MKHCNECNREISDIEFENGMGDCLICFPLSESNEKTDELYKPLN